VGSELTTVYPGLEAVVSASCITPQRSRYESIRVDTSASLSDQKFHFHFKFFNFSVSNFLINKKKAQRQTIAISIGRER